MPGFHILSKASYWHGGHLTFDLVWQFFCKRILEIIVLNLEYEVWLAIYPMLSHCHMASLPWPGSFLSYLDLPVICGVVFDYFSHSSWLSPVLLTVIRESPLFSWAPVIAVRGKLDQGCFHEPSWEQCGAASVPQSYLAQEDAVADQGTYSIQLTAPLFFKQGQMKVTFLAWILMLAMKQCFHCIMHLPRDVLLNL